MELPELPDFRPTASDDPDAPPRPPLGRAPESWRSVVIDGVRYERELNTMPQWAGSCWYYLRFLDPDNGERFVGREIERYWMLPERSAAVTPPSGHSRSAVDPAPGVDLYVGGAEHAVLHLLYARFWHKVLHDLGHVSTPEPFGRLFNQGYIQAHAYQDERGMYVEAAAGGGARRRILPRRQAGDALARQDGQEPQERGGSRRGVRAVRMRHHAPLRDVHGPARRLQAVGAPRHHRHAPLPPPGVEEPRRGGGPADARGPTDADAVGRNSSGWYTRPSRP